MNTSYIITTGFIPWRMSRDSGEFEIEWNTTVVIYYTCMLVILIMCKYKYYKEEHKNYIKN